MLLSQVSDVKHDAFLIIENDFVALETEYSFSNFLFIDALWSFLLAFRSLLKLSDLERLAYQGVGVSFWRCTDQAKLNVTIILVDENRLVKQSLQVCLADFAHYGLDGLVFENHF